MHLLSLAIKYLKFLLRSDNLFAHYKQFFLTILENFNYFFGADFTRQLLRLDSVRLLVNWGRYIYYVQVQGHLKIYDGQTGDVSKDTVQHNLTAFSNLSSFGNTRILNLIRPLSLIQTLTTESNLLVIGPRSEDDLLCLLGYGFNQVRGLDLISYSPWVDLGDMHAMPYPDNTWDAILLSWVLNYSKNPKQVAKEIVRASKPGGLVAIGVDYNPMTDEEIQAKYGYSLQEVIYHNSVAEMLDLFEGHVGKVYFLHDVPSHYRDREGGKVIVIFGIEK